MAQTRFRTNWNYLRNDSDYERPAGISKMVPDQALTVRELYNRSSRGLMLTGVQMPIWHENPTFDTWDKTKDNWDLTDIIDIQEKMESRIREIEDNRKKKKESEYKALMEKLEELKILRKEKQERIDLKNNLKPEVKNVENI